MNESYKHLVGKLNLARNRFYFFQLLKGLLVVLTAGSVFIFVVALVETQAYFLTTVRTVVFYSLIVFFLIAILWFLIAPIFRLVKVLPSLTDIQLSKYISRHFREVKDKLINFIELLQDYNTNKNELILASINQKAEKLLEYNFSEVFTLKTLLNRFYTFLIVCLMLVLVNFVFPVYEGFSRIINYEVSYAPPAKFSFQLINDDLNIKRGKSLLLKVNCEGREVPEIVFVNISGTNYLMEQSDDYFEFELKYINSSFSFYFTDKFVNSERYQLQVYPNPVIIDYKVKIDPPAYTGLKIDELTNVGDFDVPFGSQVNWHFKTADVNYLTMLFKDDSLTMEKNKITHQFFKNESYHISIGNQFFDYPDLLNFDVTVLPDYYPEIELVQLKDSLNFSRFFFKGSILDDYGFHRLNFNVHINQTDTVFELPIIKQLNEQDFYYTFNFKELLEPGQTAHYYFEIADNDPFNHYKKTTSKSFQFNFPKNEELLNFENESIAELEKLMDKSFQISNDIKESIEELKFKNFSGNSTNWEKQQLANEIVNKKNLLDSILEKIQKKNKMMNEFMNSFSEEKLEIIEKQKELEQLLEDVLSDELKELFEEFNKLAQDFKSDDFNKMNDRYELSLDDLSKQLERNLQALKRMKVEQKLDRLANFLIELSETEKTNSVELETTKDFKNTIKYEKENSDSFKNVDEEISQIFELNKELQKPLNIPTFEKENEQIRNQFQDILDKLTKKKKNKSIESIDENSKMLKSFSNSIFKTLDQNKQKQNFENIQNIRQILDNLVFLSLQQEILLEELNSRSASDPQINKIIGIQDILIDQTSHVKDSLYALGNRTAAIGNVINKELINLEFSMNKSKEELKEDRISSAKKSQQSSITALNNMAIFLDEALKNLEEQMANSMPGDQQCDKPGNKGKSSFNMLKQNQESLKQQLQQMIEQMKSGNSQNLSEQLGKTLSQQEVMQKMIRDLINSDEIGSSSKEQLKQINQLIENSKNDIINKRISQQTINRQNLILDRLLKAEKAEIEREIDDERDSKTAKEKFYSNPAAFFEYKKKETKFDDRILRKKYQLKKFYKEKYRDYINQVSEKD